MSLPKFPPVLVDVQGGAFALHNVLHHPMVLTHTVLGLGDWSSSGDGVEPAPGLSRDTTICRCSWFFTSTTSR